MAEYKGHNLAVVFNTVDISGQARSVTVNEEAGEPEQLDVTHKGDSERQLLEGFAGAQRTSVEMNILDDDDGDSALLDFAVNAKDTLFVYPEGRTHTYQEIVIQNARLISRAEPIVYDQAVEITANFLALNNCTRGTYSSA
jgi:hypothetical protein